MKKKILTALILTILCTIALGVISASAAKEGYLTYTVSDGEAEITDCDTSATGELVIPDTLGGYPVTSIGDYAFSDCTVLTSVTIPDSVTSIGRCAFYECTGLTSVTIPDSVTSIGDSAFYNCDGLTKVNITDIAAWCNVEFYNSSSNPLYYAKKLYLNGEPVTNLIIPYGVTSIGDYAFAQQKISGGGGGAAGGGGGSSSSLIKVEEELITYTGIASVSIPNSVTSIGYSAFYNCTGLTSVTIGGGVTSIGDRAFYSCDCLTSVTIPDSVKSIGDYAFQYCGGLTSVTIGEGIELIPEKTFYDCGNLKYVALSSNIKYIRNDAFNGCSSLETVFFEGSESEWNEILFYNRNENLTDAKIVYNATKKTYSFETNCDEALPDITDYAIFTMPTVKNDGATLSGWYDNEALSGEPVTFPYNGDATTLYAGWTDRTGKSFDDAFIAKANQEYTVTTTENGQFMYFEFVPKHSKEYRFYSTGSKDTYGYLYDSNKSQLTSDDDDGDGNNFYISYNLTAGQTYYIGAKVYSGTGTFTVVIEEPVDYRIEEISITDMSGNTLSSIPNDKFLATVSFTNVSSSEDTVIVLGQYSENNEFRGLMYVKTKDVPEGSTIELMLPLDNTSGNIAKLKAFCWESFTSPAPMGNAVSFPAEAQ